MGVGVAGDTGDDASVAVLVISVIGAGVIGMGVGAGAVGRTGATTTGGPGAGCDVGTGWEAAALTGARGAADRIGRAFGTDVMTGPKAESAVGAMGAGSCAAPGRLWTGAAVEAVPRSGAWPRAVRAGWCAREGCSGCEDGRCEPLLLDPAVPDAGP